MFEKIRYYKPTHQDKRRRTGFWLALGNFLGSALLLYLASSILIVLALIIMFAKLISNA